MLLAAAQLDAAPPALLSVKKTAGPGGAMAGGGGPKLRLLVSPVKPCDTQFGAPVPPEMIFVLGTIVAPLLKLAWSPQQSPKTLNSAIVQNCDRLTILSSFEIAAAGAPG